MLGLADWDQSNTFGATLGGGKEGLDSLWDDNWDNDDIGDDFSVQLRLVRVCLCCLGVLEGWRMLESETAVGKVTITRFGFTRSASSPSAIYSTSGVSRRDIMSRRYSHQATGHSRGWLNCLSMLCHVCIF